jgi:hypothetical protein
VMVGDSAALLKNAGVRTAVPLGTLHFRGQFQRNSLPLCNGPDQIKTSPPRFSCAARWKLLSCART